MGEDNLHLPNNASKQSLHSLFHSHVCLRPKDNHSPLPISAIRCGHSQQQRNRSIHPMGIHLPWPISAIQGDHWQQHLNMCVRPMDSDLSWPISTIQDGHWKQLCNISVHSMGTDWPWPIFFKFKVTIRSSTGTCPFIPWALIGPGPFQYFRVTI